MVPPIFFDAVAVSSVSPILEVGWNNRQFILQLSSSSNMTKTVTSGRCRSHDCIS